MGIYDINFDQTSYEIIPTHKREEGMLAILDSLAAPLQDVSTFFKKFREGSLDSTYSDVTTYTFGQYVVYQRRVYIRTEVTTGYSAGINPGNTTYWTKILDYFVGMDDRIRFNGQRILFEYALNKIFGTTFNQPPALSDIYITDVDTDDDDFLVGEFDTDTALVSETDQQSVFYVAENDPNLLKPDFIIHVPVAVWTALSADSSQRSNIIISVANLFKIYGYFPTVVTY